MIDKGRDEIGDEDQREEGEEEEGKVGANSGLAQTRPEAHKDQQEEVEGAGIRRR